MSVELRSFYARPIRYRSLHLGQVLTLLEVKEGAVTVILKSDFELCANLLIGIDGVQSNARRIPLHRRAKQFWRTSLGQRGSNPLHYRLDKGMALILYRVYNYEIFVLVLSVNPRLGGRITCVASKPALPLSETPLPSHSRIAGQ
jgi:hypothetical protein